MKGLVLEYLTHNNQRYRQKNFQEGAIEKKQKEMSISTPSKPSFISCGGLGDTLVNIVRSPTSKISCIMSPYISEDLFQKNTHFRKNAYF